jgi:zinc protease
VIGWRNEMEQLTRQDAIAFYKKYYAPNNAIVVVAGDVEPDAVLTMAKETYGKIPKTHDFAPRLRPKDPPPAAVRSLTLADPRVEQPSLSRSYLVPSFATAKAGESEAIEVLAHILGHGSNSRLYTALVVGKRSAVSAGAWYDSSALDMTSFAIYGVPAPDVTLPQLDKDVDGVIADVVEHGVTAEELERAKTRLIADAVYAADSQTALARWYGTALTTGGSVESVQTWPARIKAVTAQQVQDAARRWLEKKRSVTGFLVKETAPRADKRT